MRWFAVLLLAGVAVAVPAAAQDAAPPAAPQPMQLFIAPSGEPFRAPFGQPYPVGQWFAQADANHDGRVNSSEFVFDFMHFFDTLDTNHDGTLDASEIAHYETDIAPEVRGGLSEGSGRRGGFGGGHLRGDRSGWGQRRYQDMGGGDADEEPQEDGGGWNGGSGGRTRMPPQGGARFDLLGLAEPVSSMASQLNGAVTRSAAAAAATDRFEALETSGRGYLTLDMLPEPPAQRFARRHHRG